jgi:hypothetical protein
MGTVALKAAQARAIRTRSTKGINMTTSYQGDTPETPSRKSTRIDALIFLVFLALAGGGAYYALFLHK